MCTVFSINIFSSEVKNDFMKIGIVNYQELNSELEIFAAKIEAKLAKQFIQKSEMEQFATRLDNVESGRDSQAIIVNNMRSQLDSVRTELDTAVRFEHFSRVVLALSDRCKELDQKIEELSKENGQLTAQLRKTLDESLGAYVKKTENSVQRLTTFVLGLQERLEEYLDNSLPSSKSETPRPEQEKKDIVLTGSPSLEDFLKLDRLKKEQAEKLPWRRVS